MKIFQVEEKLRLKAELIVKLEIQDEQNKRVKKQIETLKNQKDQNQVREYSVYQDITLIKSRLPNV